jgi:hypothetical protein
MVARHPRIDLAISPAMAAEPRQPHRKTAAEANPITPAAIQKKRKMTIELAETSPRRSALAIKTMPLPDLRNGNIEVKEL